MPLEFKPVVSVITPVFNAERYLRRVVKSVQQQSISFEHILIDDGSTDVSRLILSNLELIYPTIKIIFLDKNSGPIIARNVGIAAATGRYLAFLDADDFWLPEKLEKQIAFMQKEECAISFTDYRFVSDDGGLIGELVHGPNKIGWRLHHMTRYLGCLTIIIDREKIPDFIFPSINPSYRAEDFLAWAYVLTKTDAALRCPFDLARYSVVRNSRSSYIFRAIISVWRLYRKVEKISLFSSLLYFTLYIFFSLSKRIYCRPRFLTETIDKDCLWYYL